VSWSSVGRWVLIVGLLPLTEPSRGQDASVPEGPKPRETFEEDLDHDGIPDGWYNLRDARVADHGYGGASSKCFRFENTRPGRPCRASRAFGVDGREVEAIIVGAWVRCEDVAPGERLGDDPSLVIDFLGDPLQLKAVRRGTLGPWKTIGREWTHVAKRLPIPPDTRLAILSMGLIGATGVLEVDDLTIELMPVGGTPTANLVLNGGFELGDPDATGWTTDRGAHRVCPGHDSPAAVELKGPGAARAYAGLSLPVGRFRSLEVSAMVRASGLRGATGALGLVFFLDNEGRALSGMTEGVPVLSFSGSFGWTLSRERVDVPPGAVRALIHFEKASAYGTLTVDDVQVIAGDGEVRWTPYHVATGTTGWTPVAPSPTIVAGSALDASKLLDAPAGKHGFVVVRDGRLAFQKGNRARFFGVSLLPPTAFLEPAKIDPLLDRLARSGVNLIRLADLDTPFGPARSLFDDAREDTAALDPDALARLDHLIAAASSRGIYVAIEFQGSRRFRDGDTAIPDGRKLPGGGGPAAAFDPKVRAAALAAIDLFVNHKNAETGRTLRDEPSLAWFTLAGELSLFDLVDLADRESKATIDSLRTLMRKNDVPSARRGWQAVESNQWSTLAGEVRQLGLHVPIAGGSHWKRDHDLAAATAASGLDLIDDRLYYSAPGWIDPEHRSLLWARDNGLAGMAALKRKTDRPYVVGQWAVPTFSAWAAPFEGADLIVAAHSAALEDWDALVRRGVFLFPQVWGSAAAGTGGGEDIFNLTEVINGIPQTFALLPHAASILRHSPSGGNGRVGKPAGAKAGTPGRLVVDTPHTRGLVGWGLEGGLGSAKFDGLTVAAAGSGGVVLVSSLGPEPISASSRLLVTAVGRVEPTGYRSADEWRREPGEPGRPPLLHEGVSAQITWNRAGTIRAYALDNTGARIKPARVEQVEGSTGGVRLDLDGQTPALHWELVVE